MSERRASRYAYLAIGAMAAGAMLVATTSDADARTRKAPADVGRIETPYGLQGLRGGGPNVIVPFSLVDSRRRPTDVEVQFGIDRNKDGSVSEDEWLPATEDQADPRNTRKNRGSRKFTTAGNIGAAHGFAWNASADLPAERFETLQLARTPDGRLIPDPENPGSFLFEPGVQPGVQLRVRAVKGQGKRQRVGEWVETDVFSLNNNTNPQMAITGVVPNTTSTPAASDEVVIVNWTAIDADSEDTNGNGILDLQEDRDGDGEPDFESISVAFDYFRVPDGLDPTTLTPSELDELAWLPCTRADGVGDPNDGVPAAPGGLPYQFAWDSLTDVGTANANYILRARPYDQKDEGDIAYLATPFRVENWKVFSNPNLPDTTSAELAQGVVGMTATNLTAGLPNSETLHLAPSQAFLVAGGATAAGGNGTRDVSLMLVNSLTAETSRANRVSLQQFQMLTARAWHTATLLEDGRVLLTGGVDGTGARTGTTEIYDPATRSIGPGPDMLVPRSHHTAVRLTNGDVAFFGGIGLDGQPVAQIETFRFAPEGAGQEPNVLGPSLDVAQSSPTCVLLPDQTILVTNGVDSSGNAVRTAQIYAAFNPARDDTPTRAIIPGVKDPLLTTLDSTMLEARKGGAAVPMIDGNVMFIGGGAGAASASLEIYNFETQTFEPALTDFSGGGMPDGGRAQLVANRLGDGSIFVAGGTTDASNASAPLVAGADILRVTGRDSGGTWTVETDPTNGDMINARRGATSVVTDNGRVFVVGGLSSDNLALAGLEVYTPEGGVNYAPSVRVTLTSNRQSWAFGAPIVYRVADPEGDPARVVLQWSDDAGVTWNAATAQESTIAGDFAESTANVASTTNDDVSVAIIPANAASDHLYIWGMSFDILRPPPGGETGPYNIRVLTEGAQSVFGGNGVSIPVTVLFNTKVVGFVAPFEDPDGNPDINQGGDIIFNAHMRDIDGGEDQAGDPATVLYEYAVDKNNDGQITAGAEEFWFPMTPAGTAVGEPLSANPQNVTTFFNAPEDSDPETRPADKGWSQFVWDALFDLGPQTTPAGNIFARVTPDDGDEGIRALIRNLPGEDPVFILTQHPHSVFPTGFAAVGGDNNAVRVNEPIEIYFNGLVGEDSVNSDTIQVFRGGSQVAGQYVVDQDTDAVTTTVTFYPNLQNLNNGEPTIGLDDSSTVLFPGQNYGIRIPGYLPGDDPRNGTMVRPDNAGFPDVVNTYRLVNALGVAGGPNWSFTTTDGNYDDGLPVQVTDSFPNNGDELEADGGTVSFTVNGGVDINSVNSDNIEAFVDLGAVPAGERSASVTATRAVIPGDYTVTNVRNPDGTTSSTIIFTPHFRLPTGSRVVLDANDGLIGFNGSPIQNADRVYTASSYGSGQVAATTTEEFDDTDFRDAGATTATWTGDPCLPGAMVGLTDGATAPSTSQGALTVASGETRELTAINGSSEIRFSSITVEEGGELVLRFPEAPVIWVDGDFDIDGVVTFRGEDGWSGHNGQKSSTAYYITSRNRSKRAGGKGFNGGNDGGESDSGTASAGRTAGDNGDGGASAGQGGRVSSGTSSALTNYEIGAGGGAGGGNATPGFPGGPAQSQEIANGVPSTSYGGYSTAGQSTGDAEMLNGPEPGGGGGGGGSHRYSSVYYNQGGAGGASAGAVTFVVDGDFNLGATGYVDGRGGNGGQSAHFAGAGGGGAGGSLHLKCGGSADLQGIIDLRGGKGGAKNQGYYSRTAWDSVNRRSTNWQNNRADIYGPTRFGGDGGLGRLRVEAGNLSDVDTVRVFGQLMTEQISALPTTTASSSGSFPQFGGTVSNSSGVVRYDGGTLDAGRTLNVQTTGSANKMVMYVDGDTTINGTVASNGAGATTWSSSQQNTGQLWSTSGVPTNLIVYQGPMNNDGGKGGRQGSSGALLYEGTNGEGPSAGTQDSGNPMGWRSGSNTYYNGDRGGSGGGNATRGYPGYGPVAESGIYNHIGSIDDVIVNGQNGIRHYYEDTSGDDGAGDRLDPSDISVDNLEDFRGSGGGGGNLPGYSSRNWAGYSGSAGAGGGAFAMVVDGDLVVNGTFEARGGEGNRPGAASYQYGVGGGGGGSGGTILLIANSITIAEATSEVGTGATFDLSGGNGGGWRSLRSGGVWRQYPIYNSGGNFAGDGGDGRVVLQYVDDLNDGAVLVNKYGMTQSTPDPIRNQYKALAGSYTFACRSLPAGGTGQSTWYDMGSLIPKVTNVSAVSARANLTLTASGAQSHPHNAGPDGIGEADPASATAFQGVGGGSTIENYRFIRFKAVFTRTSTTGLPPEIGSVTIDHTTDDL